MSAVRLYRYSALVNEQRRSVTFTAAPEDWGHEPTTESDDTVTPAELNLETAALIVDNTQDAYARFYAGATDADYDAERESATLEALVPAHWEVIE